MACKPSLVEVLGRHSLTEQKINVACSHEHAEEIASKVNKWERLVLSIGLTDIEVTAIQRDKPNDYRLQCSAALLKWRQKFGSEATYLSLAKGLEKVGHLDLVETVCKAFQRDGCGTSIIESKCLGTKTELPPLSERVKGFETRFKSLVKDTFMELKKNNVTTDDIQFDLTLLPSDIRDNHINYIEKNIKNLTKADNLKEIFCHLNLYWDSFNYTLLEMIVNNYGSTGLRKKMTEYVRDLRQFWRKTTVAEYIPLCKSKKKFTTVPKELAEVTGKLRKPVSQCTLLELEELRFELCQRYNLQKFALMLFDVDEGSVTVTWLVSREFLLNFETPLEDVTSTEIWRSVYLLLVDRKCVHEKVSAISTGVC